MACTIPQNSPKKWTDKKIPYKLGGNLSDSLKKNIHEAINFVNGIFYIIPEWAPHNGETNYVEFIKISGTSNSPVGMIGGQQMIELGSRASIRTVIHEMFHAMGANHEMTRPDRNSHIIVHEEQIPFKKRYNYRELLENECATWDTEFDFKSIMMYPRSTSYFEQTLSFIDFYPNNTLPIATLYGYSDEMSVFFFYDSQLNKINSVQLGTSYSPQIQMYIQNGIKYCLFYDKRSGHLVTNSIDTDLHNTTILTIEKNLNLLTLFQDKSLNHFLLGYMNNTGEGVIYEIVNKQTFRKTGTISSLKKTWTHLFGFNLYSANTPDEFIPSVLCYDESCSDFEFISISSTGNYQNLLTGCFSTKWRALKIINVKNSNGISVNLLFRYTGANADLEIVRLDYGTALTLYPFLTIPIGHDFEYFTIANLYIDETTKQISFKAFFYASEDGYCLSFWKKFNYETGEELLRGDVFISGDNYTPINYSGKIRSGRPTASDVKAINELYS